MRDPSAPDALRVTPRNLTENVTGGASGQSVHGAVSLDATGNQSDTTDAVGASHHGNNSVTWRQRGKNGCWDIVDALA